MTTILHTGYTILNCENQMKLNMLKATRMVTLATKSLLFEYLVPERVGHSVGTGPHVDKAEMIMGFFLCFTQGDFGRSRT
jgi:hypothetical protein